MVINHLKIYYFLYLISFYIIWYFFKLLNVIKLNLWRLIIVCLWCHVLVEAINMCLFVKSSRWIWFRFNLFFLSFKLFLNHFPSFNVHVWMSYLPMMLMFSWGIYNFNHFKKVKYILLYFTFFFVRILIISFLKIQCWNRLWCLKGDILVVVNFIINSPVSPWHYNFYKCSKIIVEANNLSAGVSFFKENS